VTRMALRIGEWKFIYDPEEKLYNLREDPEERENRLGRFPELERYFKRIVAKDLLTEREMRRIEMCVSGLKGKS